MRVIVTVIVAFALFAFTSCSKTQQHGSHAAANPSTSSETDSVAPSGAQPDDVVHAVKRGADGHKAETHEASRHHGGHEDTHADHHASGDQHGGKQSPHSTRHHGHEGHDHPAEHDAGHESKHIAVGDKVPDFEVSIDGEKFKLSDLQKNTSITEDGTLVLTFWCSFCHSCRDVEHDLDALAKQYKGRVGVLALDASAGETTEKVVAFAKENELTLPIALNADGTAADIFGVRATTTTVVIDGDGVLRYCGQFSDDQHAFAEDALKAVLVGEEVRIKKTRHKG